MLYTMNCWQKKFFSNHLSLRDKGHYMKHVMLIKLLEMTSTLCEVIDIKMSFYFNAGLFNLQLNDCGHLGIKFIRKVWFIRI